MRMVTLALLAACGGAPRPELKPELKLETSPLPIEVEAHGPPPRLDYPVGPGPLGMVVSNDRAIVWTDGAGAIWTLPVTGGTPKQLSNQHTHAFAFHPVLVGPRQVYVTTKRDIYAVTLPDGPVTALGAKLLEDPEAAVADSEAVYVTLFKREEVMRIPIDGSAPQKLFDLPQGVLAINGSTLYAASYSTGVFVAAPTAGGAPRRIADGLSHPTAIAVNDTYAFVYTQTDKTLYRITLATGAKIALATNLEHADVVTYGDAVYASSWGDHDRLLQIPIAGGKPRIMADDLGSPYALFVNADAVFVTSRDQNKIVRFTR